MQHLVFLGLPLVLHVVDLFLNCHYSGDPLPVTPTPSTVVAPTLKVLVQRGQPWSPCVKRTKWKTGRYPGNQSWFCSTRPIRQHGYCSHCTSFKSTSTALIVILDCRRCSENYYLYLVMINCIYGTFIVIILTRSSFFCFSYFFKLWCQRMDHWK